MARWFNPHILTSFITVRQWVGKGFFSNSDQFANFATLHLNLSLVQKCVHITCRPQHQVIIYIWENTIAYKIQQIGLAYQLYTTWNKLLFHGVYSHIQQPVKKYKQNVKKSNDKYTWDDIRPPRKCNRLTSIKCPQASQQQVAEELEEIPTQDSATTAA